MSTPLPSVAAAPAGPTVVVAPKPTSVTSAAASVAAARGVAAPAPPAPQPRATAAAPAAAPAAVATRAPAAAQAAVAPEAAAPHYWQAFFRDWPSQIPKRGIVTTQQNEVSPFKGYMLRGDFVLFERASPDALGGRFVVLPCQEIASVKFTDPLKQAALEAAGFVGTLSN